MHSNSDFEGFYRQSKDRCLRAFIATVPDVTIADDLIAEAFTRALERWDDVCRHPTPEAWIVRTALNLNHDRWRKSQRRVRHLDAFTNDDSSVNTLDPALVEALLDLSPRQREVLAHRILLGLTNQETATALGIGEGTVPVHLHRALERLRRIFPTKESFHDRSRR